MQVKACLFYTFMLSKELIYELKIILKEEFNLELSNKDLEKMARNLVGYFDLLARLHYGKEQKNG